MRYKHLICSMGTLFAKALHRAQGSLGITRKVDTIEVKGIPTALVPEGVAMVMVDSLIVWTDGVPPWLPGANAVTDAHGIDLVCFNRKMLKYQEFWVPVVVHEIYHHELDTKDEFAVDKAARELLGEEYTKMLVKMSEVWGSEASEEAEKRIKKLEEYRSMDNI